jgi:hypothetical protein
MSWETMANVVIAFRRNWGIFCEEGCMVCEIGEERAATPLTPRPSSLKLIPLQVLQRRLVALISQLLYEKV